MTEESSFCPLIKGDCKKEKCKFWRMEDCSIAMFMETQGVTFFNAVADMEDTEKEKEEEIPVDYSWLTETSEDKIITELVDYAFKELPDDKYLTHFIKKTFWSEKKIDDSYDLPRELRLKVELIENKADMLFNKRLLIEEKEKLTKIVDECYNWAIGLNSTKLTKADVNAYIMENEILLTQTSKDILYSKVNMKLKSTGA
jgi:hypothetical protein